MLFVLILETARVFAGVAWAAAVRRIGHAWINVVCR
jgi:hypothetical protein